MGVSKFVNTLLLGLCSNYPPKFENISSTTPSWKWDSFISDTRHRSDERFQCKLLGHEQLAKNFLRGKHIILVAAKDMYPITMVKRINGTLVGGGLSFMILNTLRKKLGFTYEIVVPPKTGMYDGRGGGFIDMITAGKADMGTVTPLIPRLNDVLDWGESVHFSEYVVLMKRPKESATGSGLLAPFESEVWLLIILSLVIVGPIIYAIMKLRRKLCRDSNAKMYSLSNCVWFVYGALMKQGSSLSPPENSTRVMLATWWIFIVILTSFYTANLTAFLTLTRFTLPIKSLDDVAHSSQRWNSAEGSYLEYMVKNNYYERIPLYHSWKESRGNFINMSKREKVKDRLRKGELLLYDREYLTYFMLEHERRLQHENERCAFVMTTEIILSSYMSFVFKKNSVLPKLFNPFIRYFFESGMVRQYILKNIPEAVLCPINLGSKERQLRNSDLSTTYLIMMSGFILATVAFWGEIIFWLCVRKRATNSISSKVIHFQSRQKLLMNAGGSSHTHLIF